MRKLILPIALFLLTIPCYQSKAAGKIDDSTLTKKISYDTNRITIIPVGSISSGLFKGIEAAELTNGDLLNVDRLLNNCINNYNSKQDTTKGLFGFIRLENYRRQYVTYIDPKGLKKVYVNCFCFTQGQIEFDYWKKSLVMVYDGGACFFQLTINLSTLSYEAFSINGYA